MRTVLEAMMALTGSEKLPDPSSPQYRAAQWLADADPFVREQGLRPSDAKFIQRYAVAVLYYSLGGDYRMFCGWQNYHSCEKSEPWRRPWLTEYDECDWWNLDCSDGVRLDNASFRTFGTILERVAPL
jgi:hypothetical protein